MTLRRGRIPVPRKLSTPADDGIPLASMRPMSSGSIKYPGTVVLPPDIFASVGSKVSCKLKLGGS